LGRILTVNSLRKKRIYCRLGCMCKNGGEDALKCSTQGRANNGRKGLRDGVGGLWVRVLLYFLILHLEAGGLEY
jgi:hypothetical protein